MPIEDNIISSDFTLHQLSWSDFDDLARGEGGARVVQRLRQSERSRRLLLLRALTDQVSKDPDLAGPLPSPDAAWELLARVQDTAPEVLDLMLAHPYTGAWIAYTTRLLNSQISGVCPLWMHIGHMHALAAAGAIRAGINFDTQIPVWEGGAILPTLGMARLIVDSSCSVATVRAEGNLVEVSAGACRVHLPRAHPSDARSWWSIRRVTAGAGQHPLSVRLDDLDPYRGLHEPVLPQRLAATDVSSWHALLGEAWPLIVRGLPEVARAIPSGLDSLVPWPAIALGSWSASTGEAFGSAAVAMPPDAESLAATLVHEFQHIRLGGLLHLTPLHDDDPRERFYTPWRDDPRPIGAVLQGIYAFFGVAAFWRAMISSAGASDHRRAAFEFTQWRSGTWLTLRSVRADPSLTRAGHRFLSGIAERLSLWQNEPVPADLADLAKAVAADHYAGWRIRHLRPSAAAVSKLAASWLSGRTQPAGLTIPDGLEPTPVPDGTWSTARTELIRFGLTQSGRSRPHKHEPNIPDATAADYAYVAGRATDAVHGFRAELFADPDRPASWVGLGLALSALGNSPAARTLLRYPELVRAVHRAVRADTRQDTLPDELAGWIGRFVY